MATVSLKSAVSIVTARQTILDFARDACEKHAKTIRRETKQFDVRRGADPVSWGKLCMVKAILSPGANLDKNISLAKVLHAKMLAGWVPADYDDVEPIRKSVKYGARSGANITNLVASWATIAAMDEASLTYDGLTALYEANLLPGMGQKVRSWAMALYDANSQVITLDVHMLRGMLRLANLEHGAESYSAKGSAYDVLSTLMLSIAEELGVEPLVMQWACWNEFRHAGKHAGHASLAK